MTVDPGPANNIQAGQPWEVQRFEPGDAEGVVRLFKSVYGDGYPVRTYVEPDLLIRENKAGRTISSVARTPRGDIVGHNAMFNSAPHPGTFESGAGVVHAAYRGGKGIFTRMVSHGLELAAELPGVDAVFGEPVCNHPFTQKLMNTLAFVSSALEVDLMPAAAYAKEASASGRVAAFLAFRTCRTRPHAVFLPRDYAGDLPFFYQGLDDKRDFRISEDAPPAGSRTDLSHQVFDFAAVARVAVPGVGEDFAARMAALETTLTAAGVLVIQVWLNLGQSWVSAAVETLRARGYFLGGVLPRWFDTDGLLMQKICKLPDWDGICIASDRLGQILELVRADWQRSQKEE
jgi:hypothetical protein